MPISITPRGRVTASRSFIVPLTARQLWGQMRDVEHFIAIDPLHQDVSMNRQGLPTPRGASLTIPHRLLGLGPTRIGRILQWREGSGFAFSDLSRRGVRKGFPHVCSYWIEPLSNDSCQLTVNAVGRWTARWVPRPLARLWLWWVLAATESDITAHCLAYRRWLHRRGRAKGPRHTPEPT